MTTWIRRLVGAAILAITLVGIVRSYRARRRVDVTTGLRITPLTRAETEVARILERTLSDEGLTPIANVEAI